MTGREKAKERYEKWWVGQLCRVNGHDNFKRVVGVKVSGPPSFVYGIAWLIFEDGSTADIDQGPDAFKPRKCDVEIQTVI